MSEIVYPVKGETFASFLKRITKEQREGFRGLSFSDFVIKAHKLYVKGKYEKGGN